MKRLINILLIALCFIGSISHAYERDLDVLQQEFRSWKFGMFVHFNMSTFVPGGWSTGQEDPLKFNPTELDFNQWADAALSANMKYGVLTVKHTGGWSLWQSDVAERDMADFKNYKNGQGDIVAEYVKAFRDKNLKVGLYYCFPLFNPRWANYQTLAKEGYAQGKVDAVSFIKDQFTELLTNYGTIDLIWIDQSATKNGGMKSGDWLEIKRHIHELQPNTLVIANNQTNLALTDIYSYEYPYSLELPPAGNTMVTEVADKLQQGWFSNPASEADPVRTLDYVVNKMLRPLNNNNSNYLLNVAPNKHGLMSKATVSLLKDIGKEWHPNEQEKTNNNIIGITQQTISQVANKNNNVGLLFDISKDITNLGTIIDTLKQYGASASFVVSEYTVNNAKKTLKNLIAQGHTIVNGTKNHVDLTVKEKGRFIRDQIKPVQKSVNKITKVQPLLFKSPEDKYNTFVWNALNYQGLVAIDSSLTVASMPEANSLDVHSGDIVEIGVNKSDISHLPAILTKLNTKNLNGVTIESLMASASDAWIRDKLNSKTSAVSGMQ